ncbi:Fis family transcriptional regulator [Pseudomonas sp. PIC25]|uniref:sigma-54 dependent transcriptional regulator n=1 Tax=Pseudomonas sp. PIC25 TaxID=1958773 RepID=UPI000BAB6C16|nr:sigma 54-interacting transcriptional regulator [Pseudomonas sp. PIC25]PAU55279.1 Fis family transcriptional regulator [Pseudomonas sp. PIC25]
MLEAVTPTSRRVLVVDPDDECEPLLEALGACAWGIERCELDSAPTAGYEIGLLCLRPEHLSHLGSIRALISQSGTEWMTVFDPELLPAPGVNDFIGEWFFDGHALPGDPLLFQQSLGHAMSLVRLRGLSRLHEQELIGHSRALRGLRKQLAKLGPGDAPVLIQGESGTGKTLAARVLHRHSRRVGGPFVVVDCAVFPEERLGQTLFGSGDDHGRLFAARGGTLLLDDIAAMPLTVQQALFERLSMPRRGRADVRILATTRSSLHEAVTQGRFDVGLFGWLGQQTVDIAPLRKRQGDIALLATHFLALYGADSGRHPPTFSDRALAAMARYHWPGNVRELATRVRRGFALADDTIEANDLGLEGGLPGIGLLGTLEDYKRRAEYQALCDALTRYSNNLSLAARMLGISRPTFYRLLHKHQLL